MENTKKQVLVQKITDKLNNDEVFCREFVSSEDALSLKKVLSANGIELTTDEVEKLFDEGLNEILKFKDAIEKGELTEEQLDDVAGGKAFKGAVRTAVTMAASFGWGCAVGVCPVLAAGTPYVVGGLVTWTTAGYLSKK